eukprot:UN23357
MLVKPRSLYHDAPVKIPKGQSHCVVCGEKTNRQCWGCLLDLKDLIPVCPNCFQEMHKMRNKI